MTPEQESKVLALKGQFIERREQAMQAWGTAGTALTEAQQQYDAAGNRWHALDSLATADDGTLLQLSELLP